jgi:hypothetical protein
MVENIQKRDKLDGDRIHKALIDNAENYLRKGACEEKFERDHIERYDERIKPFLKPAWQAALENEKKRKESELSFGNLFKKSVVLLKTSPTVVLRILASTLLIIAVSDQPRDYYTILKWIVCPICFYNAVLAYRLQKKEWIWILALIALFFNPLRPVHLEQETWQVIDVLVSIILLVSIGFIHERKQNLVASSDSI